MVQLVADHRVLRPQNRFKQTAIGIETGGIQDRIVHTQKMRYRRFQLFVAVLRTADKPHGSQAVALFLIRFLRRLNQTRIVAQPEIVVRAHVDDLAAVFQFHMRGLGCDDRTLAFE